MTTVFLAGSMNIRHLAPAVKERIRKVLESNFDIIVGDADGVDASIQDYLVKHGGIGPLGEARAYTKVTVYCSGPTPRNNLGDWPVRAIETKHPHGSRAFFTAKDLSMAEEADYGLMIWDTKSTGTLSNIIELLSRKKKSVIFINKEKLFRTIGDTSQLEALVKCMSEHARKTADEKIKLSEKIDSLRQTQMFA